jgi:pSer/pThr/pTyr-binding forkhead associated (FHA) protein
MAMCLEILDHLAGTNREAIPVMVVRRAANFGRPNSLMAASSKSGFAPSAPSPKIKVFTGGAVNTVVSLADRPLVVGRSHDADLRLDDEGVSRTHCKVYVRDGLIYVEDLGSANGTLVNGVTIVGATAIGPGDRVQLGLAVFGLDDEEESPHSA